MLVLEIPDIFLGTVNAGSEPTHEEKMRVPGSPWGTLLQILILPVTRNIAKYRLHRVT